MASLEDVFRACDTRGNGYLERQELSDLCSKFGIGKTEADSLFEDLDCDTDGRISFKDFANGFSDFLTLSTSLTDDNEYGEDEGPRKQRLRAESIDGVIEVRLQPYKGERAVLKDSSSLQFSPKSINPEALEDLLEEMKKLQEENKKLEENWTRERKEHERHLRRLELELDSQVQQVEIQAKKKAQAEAEEEKKSIRLQMDAEMDQMQANLLLFEKVDSFLKTNKGGQTDKKLCEVRGKLDDASHENRQLRMSLMDTQTNIAVMRSEIAQLRTQYEEKCRELSSEREKCMEVLHEQDHVSRQLHVLHDANKRLQDTNDTLRVALETTSVITQQARSYSSFLLQAKRGSIIGDYLNQDRRYRSAVDIAAEDGSDQWELGSTKSKPKSEDLNMMGYTLQRFVKDLANGQSGHQSDSGQSTMREPDDLEEDDGPKSLQDHLYSDKDGSLAEFDSASQVCRSVSINSTAIEATEDLRLDSGSEATVDSHYTAFKPRPQASYEPTGPPERTYKVIFIGDAAVGKSSFILRLAKGNFVKQISSTLGIDFQVRTLRVDGINVALQLWDTAGQERFRSITQSYFRKADGIMLLYDCTNERSFLNVTQWMQAVEEGTSSKLPVILVANKTDLRKLAELNGESVVMPKQGQKLAKSSKAIFIESSAKDGSNVMEAIAELVRLMSANEEREIRNSGMMLKDQAKKGRCCGK